MLGPVVKNLAPSRISEGRTTTAAGSKERVPPELGVCQTRESFIAKCCLAVPSKGLSLVNVNFQEIQGCVWQNASLCLRAPLHKRPAAGRSVPAPGIGTVVLRYCPGLSDTGLISLLILGAGAGMRNPGAGMRRSESRALDPSRPTGLFRTVSVTFPIN